MTNIVFTAHPKKETYKRFVVQTNSTWGNATEVIDQAWYKTLREAKRSAKNYARVLGREYWVVDLGEEQ